jgi:hypothetical protein
MHGCPINGQTDQQQGDRASRCFTITVSQPDCNANRYTDTITVTIVND